MTLFTDGTDDKTIAISHSPLTTHPSPLTISCLPMGGFLLVIN